MSIETYVNNFHAKAYSRLIPFGTSISSNVLRLEKSNHGQTLFYRGHRLNFAWDENKESINVTVTNPPDSERIDPQSTSLKELLNSPESLSGASKAQKKEYASVFSFRADWTHGREDLVVAYKLKRPKGLNEDEIFEAFWYWLKPVLKIIQDRKIT